MQRSYLSWNWIGIQNLDRNRVAISKLAKGIWQILTWALESLKNFHFNGLLLSKVYILRAEKYIEVIFHETKEGYQIWRGTDLSFQNGHKEFDEFWPEHSKVSKVFAWMGSFWVNYIFFELKKHGGVLCFMKLKRNTKFGEKSTCRFKVDIKNLTNFDVNTQKSQKFSL